MRGITEREEGAQGLRIVELTTPVCPRAAWMAGVWGEPSPQVPPEGAEGARSEAQVPPEARPTVGPAARVRETSQPGAEGVRRGERALSTFHRPGKGAKGRRRLDKGPGDALYLNSH